MTSRLPCLFVSHGSPMLAIDGSAAQHFLKSLAQKIVSRPRDTLVVSAHWESAIPAVSLARRPQTIHDFGGFPKELFELRYPAPGAPKLAERTAGLLESAGFEVMREKSRGLDHGAWIPPKLIFPEAGIPVTQLAIQPELGPKHHVRIGKALRPLRDQGTLILATGAITHNLQAFFQGGFGRDADTPDWVDEFAEWVANAIADGRLDDLVDCRELAPSAVRNHPTQEHLLPLFVACGAASDPLQGERLHRSAAYGVLAMDVYALR